MAEQYTVKEGDTLNKIASSLGYSDYKSAGISGFENPDLIRPGQVLSIAGGPKTQEVPGIGTMTITPKAIPATSPTSPADQNMAGAYERAGIPMPTKPPAGTANGYVAPAIAGMPSYPSGVDTQSSVENIKKSYQTMLDQVSTLEAAIAASASSSPEEKRLKDALVAKKAELDSFDIGTLSASEALTGQGRGATIANVGLQDTKLKRVRALERLGLASEAETLTTQLGLAQDARKQQGDMAQTQYSLATKKLDIALGIQDKISKISDDEKDNARQFLLDTVNFSEGKTYEQLDKDTQAAITSAVANSPITLDMVKTALKSGSEKAAASARGELRSVAGVGVVQIDPATGKYKVVVPENPTQPAANVPTFEQYLEQQNVPFPMLTDFTINKVRDEYNAKYGNATVSLGKLTAGNKTDLAQAGLSTAGAPVQSYFLNTPAEFQDAYRRDVASGVQKGAPSLDALIQRYTTWYNANKKGGTRDWEALLGTK